MWGVLVEMRMDSISGFDLSALNAFRWHPHHDRVDLSRYADVATGQLCFALMCLLSTHVRDVVH